MSIFRGKIKVKFLILLIFVLIVYLILELLPLKYFNPPYFTITFFKGIDILAHITMSFCLTIATLIGVQIFSKRQSLSLTTLIISLIILIIFTLVGEITQTLMHAGRNFSLKDTAFSLLGILIGLDLYLKYQQPS